MVRRRRWLARLLLVLGATLVALILGELVLRAVFHGRVAAMIASRSGVSAAGRRVLCLGDSYTFGLYYRQPESYPGRLEQMLRLAAGPDSWSVINRGVPAMNTAQVRAALPGLLETWEPDVVVFLGGHNNRWNKAGAPGWVHRVLERLVLVRLVRLAFAPPLPTTVRERISGWSSDEVGVNQAGGGSAIEVAKTGPRRSDDEVMASIREDLLPIVRMSQAAGARVVLLTYPSPEPGYEAPARVAREVAAATGAALVDLRRQFATLLEQRPYHELLIPGDRHPTERGHYWMARFLEEEFVRLGLVPECAAVADLPEALYEARIAPDAATGALRLQGPPGAEYRVLLAAATEPDQPFGARRIPLAADAVFQAAQEEATLGGHFDEEGAARVVVPAALAARARFAALVVYHDWKLRLPDLLVRQITAAVALR